MTIESIRFRLFWIQYGVFFLKSSRLIVRRLRIAGKSIGLSVPAGEDHVMNHELQVIFYDDCYGLRWHKLNRKIHTIVDVGANIGLFSMAARAVFPEATIHAYEPSPAAVEHFERNTENLNVRLWREAVGEKSGTVEMQTGAGSLYSTTKNSNVGSIPKVSARRLLERVGAEIDLLKLDCEGAEWEIFRDLQFWKSVNNVCMEYHLWAEPSKRLVDLIGILSDLGFRITHLREAEKQQWGILWGTKMRESIPGQVACLSATKPSTT